MNETLNSPIQSIAKNYCLCLADFPLKLKPEHLDIERLIDLRLHSLQ